MCQGPMHEFLKALPKCEHHMHLEGSLEPPLLFELASRNNISLPHPTVDPAFESISTLVARYRRFSSLDDFLQYYFIGMSVLITSSDFEALAYEYFTRARSDGVVHAEVFFDPQAHTSRGVAYSTILEGFTSAQRRANADFGITSELIMCILRHFPAQDGDAMYRAAISDLESGVVKGLGLSSTEKGNPPHLYKDTYADAKKRGFNLTAHAGEEAGVDYMASALHDLHLTRVDHGIKLPQDPNVMAEFAQKGIMVTMCPLSNVELRCVSKVAELPVRTYLEQGVPFSINSDDPAYFGGYILDNFCAVQDAFALKVEEWERLMRNSIKGSWCSEERKGMIEKALKEVVERFR
ncbi:adenosine deaminase [Rhinocladiella mackenziei CBS 650.93]|uniref:Adenine deaminase n=1 Tax=Rhinocladiella mackenziei CBS 650.93 TaxID=1442369 RepID=A0A0D2IPR8_9EURO|nr:adenosine deaminase [Rhinocladiella mackenziei CBS 650.93]KIX07889.1 adenosine deaminase [Rhinocladiella mackenziei CBS 650.93]